IAAHRHLAEGRVDAEPQEAGRDLLVHLEFIGLRQPRVLRNRGVQSHDVRHTPAHHTLLDAAHVDRHRIPQRARRDRRERQSRYGVRCRVGHVEPEGVGRYVLVTLVVGEAHIQTAEPAPAHVTIDRELRRLDFVLEFRRAHLGPVWIVRQLHDGRVGEVLRGRPVQLAFAGGETERAGGVRPRDGLDVELVAVGARIAEVQCSFPLVGEIQLVSPADRTDLVGTVPVLVVHQAVSSVDRGTLDEGIAVEVAGLDIGEVGPAAPQADVTRPVVACAVLLELRVVEIHSAVEAVARLELHDGHRAIAQLLAGGDAGLEALREQRAVTAEKAVSAATVRLRYAGGRGAPLAVVVADTPGAELLGLARRIEVREAERQTDRVVGVLIHERGTKAVAVLALARGRQTTVTIFLGAATNGYLPAIEAERHQRPDVDGARQALADHPGVHGLVHDDLIHQLRRKLVVFGGAAFTGTHHLPAVEKRAGVVFTQAADGDCGRAALNSLRGQAWQPRDGVRDAGVGQLADVFGADHLDDGNRFSFGGNRRLDRVADAGDRDLFEHFAAAGLLRSRGTSGGSENRSNCGRQGLHSKTSVRITAAEAVCCTDFHRYPPPEWKPSHSPWETYWCGSGVSIGWRSRLAADDSLDRSALAFPCQPRACIPGVAHGQQRPLPSARRSQLAV